MAGKARKGVPALKNDEVTGMTNEKQDQVIRESARAPRNRAAEEFLKEQEKQAGETKARRRPRGKGYPSAPGRART
jgi:hypothetical protein